MMFYNRWTIEDRIWVYWSWEWGDCSWMWWRCFNWCLCEWLGSECHHLSDNESFRTMENFVVCIMLHCIAACFIQQFILAEMMNKTSCKTDLRGFPLFSRYANKSFFFFFFFFFLIFHRYQISHCFMWNHQSTTRSKLVYIWPVNWLC